MTATIALPRQPHSDRLARLRTIMVLRPGQRVVNIPGEAVSVSRRAVGNSLLNALVAYWPGNEASGDLLDAHTNALHLTDTNTVTNAAGKVYSTARQYTQANFEFHTRNSEALLQSGNVDFTISAWCYANTLNPPRYPLIVGKWPDTTGQREYILMYIVTTNKFCFIVSPNGTAEVQAFANSAGAVSLSTWYHITAWHDSVLDTINIQVNNGPVDSTAHTTGVFSGTGAFRVGRLSTYYWNGRIGPVAMWKSAAGGGGVLTAAQRLALWNAGAGLPYTSFTT